MANITLEVRGLKETLAALRAGPEAIRKGATAGLRRGIQRVQGRVVKAAAEIIALKQSTLRDSIRLDFTGLSQANPEGSVNLVIKRIPLSAFPVRVRMAVLGLRSKRGKSYTRKLAVVDAEIYRGQRNTLRGGFPLRQRNSGPLRAGESVVKRTGKSRTDLTGFGLRTFTRRVVERVLPVLAQEGARITQEEVQRAVAEFIRRASK